MAEAFLGLHMLVTLSAPPGTQLQGKVSSIVAGQSLTLRDVYCPNNGNTITEITIRASDIQDLVETPQDDPHAIPTALLPASQPPSHVALPQAQSSNRFEDPAILSMGRRPQPSSTKLSTSSIPHREPVHQTLGVPTPTSVAHDGTPASMNAVLNKLVATSLLLDSNAANDNDTEVHAVKTIPEISPVPKKVKSRRNRAKASQRDATQLEPTSLPKAQETNRASGWRQTPLLEPNPSFQPFTTLKKKPRGKQADGWATEDATDVQDMGEFDFEMNLSKFDKRTVFEVLKAEDMTADEDRLVGHNRLARPGTNGGKNLHPLENVLGGLKTKAVWNSEADDSEIPLEGRRGSQRESGSGRNSRRGHSQLRRPISRKETVIDDLQKLHQPPSAHTTQKGFFYTMGTDRRCDTISALQMLNLENIADSEFSLTEDMMTENAGRGIAGLTISLLSEGGRNEARGDKIPSVVVLAGNNKSGLRAVAAGRHLRNHGMNVVVCVLGLSREEDFLVGLRRQLKAFRSFGGKVLDKIQLIDFAKDHACHLIIDGLLGLTMAFEELGTSDQATAYEIIEWSNRSGAEVMAIDIPTGIDPSSGKVGIIDGRPLYIHPTFVVAMGAAKKGLLQCMAQGEGVNGPDAWRVWVADIGIASLAWKKAGTRMRRGMDFGSQWTFEIKFKIGAD